MANDNVLRVSIFGTPLVDIKVCFNVDIRYLGIKKFNKTHNALLLKGFGRCVFNKGIAYILES